MKATDKKFLESNGYIAENSFIFKKDLIFSGRAHITLRYDIDGNWTSYYESDIYNCNFEFLGDKTFATARDAHAHILEKAMLVVLNYNESRHI